MIPFMFLSLHILVEFVQKMKQKNLTTLFHELTSEV